MTWEPQPGDAAVALFARGHGETAAVPVTVVRVTATLVTTTDVRGRDGVESRWSRRSRGTDRLRQYPSKRDSWSRDAWLATTDDPEAVRLLAAQERRELARRINAALTAYSDTGDPRHLDSARELLSTFTPTEESK